MEPGHVVGPQLLSEWVRWPEPPILGRRPPWPPAHLVSRVWRLGPCGTKETAVYTPCRFAGAGGRRTAERRSGGVSRGRVVFSWRVPSVVLSFSRPGDGGFPLFRQCRGVVQQPNDRLAGG